MNKTALSIIIAALLIAGAIILIALMSNSPSSSSEQANNVAVIDGKQVITINAKGGYSPRITTAKAGVPTILKVETKGTFDCSSAIAIPSLGYRKNLPLSGETEIEVPPQQSGSKLQGLCAMGMYNFTVTFN